METSAPRVWKLGYLAKLTVRNESVVFKTFFGFSEMADIYRINISVRNLWMVYGAAWMMKSGGGG